MKCTILHEGKGRMRVHVEKVRMTLHRADVLEAYLNHNDAIVHAAVYERTGDVVITYTGKRSAAVSLLAGYKFDVPENDALVTSADSRKLNREYQDKMFDLVAGRALRKLFCPRPLPPPIRRSAPSAFSGKVCAACCTAGWKWRCWMPFPSASPSCAATLAPQVLSCSC